MYTVKAIGSFGKYHYFKTDNLIEARRVYKRYSRNNYQVEILDTEDDLIIESTDSTRKIEEVNNVKRN